MCIVERLFGVGKQVDLVLAEFHDSIRFLNSFFSHAKTLVIDPLYYDSMTKINKMLFIDFHPNNSSKR